MQTQDYVSKFPVIVVAIIFIFTAPKLIPLKPELPKIAQTDNGPDRKWPKEKLAQTETGL